MRLSEPRLRPLEREEWDEDARQVMAKIETSGTAYNVYKTMAHTPKLFKRWVVFATHIMFKNSLSVRDRELLILRIGWLTRSGYEFSQHVRIAYDNGFTEEEIERIKVGADAPGWGEKEGALVAGGGGVARRRFPVRCDLGDLAEILLDRGDRRCDLHGRQLQYAGDGAE